MPTMTILRAAAGAFCLAVLAACGGPGAILPDDPDLTYDEMLTEGRAIFDSVASTPVTPEADMPASGTARYAGIVAIAQGSPLSGIDDGELLGTMEMDADFAGDAISGRMGNFREDFTDTAHEGELALANGQITGNGFTADISGELTPTGGGTTSYDGAMSGRFRGAGAEIVEGDVSGTVTLPNSSTSNFYGLVAGGSM
ncbi:MAG: transferrin-binding protein-like solute binding protein [Pseudooceanicola nanhaiensis]